jgi:hypothetical protein
MKQLERLIRNGDSEMVDYLLSFVDVAQSRSAHYTTEVEVDHEFSKMMVLICKLCCHIYDLQTKVELNTRFVNNIGNSLNSFHHTVDDISFAIDSLKNVKTTTYSINFVKSYVPATMVMKQYLVLQTKALTPGSKWVDAFEDGGNVLSAQDFYDREIYLENEVTKFKYKLDCYNGTSDATDVDYGSMTFANSKGSNWNYVDAGQLRPILVRHDPFFESENSRDYNIKYPSGASFSPVLNFVPTILRQIPIVGTGFGAIAGSLVDNLSSFWSSELQSKITESFRGSNTPGSFKYGLSIFDDSYVHTDYAINREKFNTTLLNGYREKVDIKRQTQVTVDYHNWEYSFTEHSPAVFVGNNPGESAWPSHYAYFRFKVYSTTESIPFSESKTSSLLNSQTLDFQVNRSYATEEYLLDGQEVSIDNIAVGDDRRLLLLRSAGNWYVSNFF